MTLSTKPPSWFSRNILRRTSSTTSIRHERGLKHRRSISDLSMRLKSRKDKLKDKDLQDLVRLCGSSILYLPAEYCSGSLTVPTCFRATAQYLVQHGESIPLPKIDLADSTSPGCKRDFQNSWLT
jgi:hypothetical protein